MVEDIKIMLWRRGFGRLKMLHCLYYGDGDPYSCLIRCIFCFGAA